MGKRVFQVLDEMNVEDGEKNTTLVGVCPDFVSADKVSNGVIITMGAPESALHGIMNRKTMPILLLVDKEEYFKRKGEQS